MAQTVADPAVVPPYPRRVASLVADDLGHGMVHMIVRPRESALLRHEIFRSLEEACRWLDLPVHPDLFDADLARLPERSAGA